ncbi:MAG: sigma-70 family RNA polymerase sigma factor [Planctomycetes bacterium]|nr:sigma-70 family RNA polymerase sigma factor [Planctomycetota bacterium]
MISSEQLANAIDRWGGRLRYWLLLRTSNADDILQETFCKLVQQKRFPERPAAWLFQVAANLIREEVRRDKRRKLREEKVASTEVVQAPADIGLLHAEVQDALQKIQPEMRDIILLKIWGEMTFAEIGKTLGLSTATAHRRYEEALAQLRPLCGAEDVRIGTYESAR